ncbi:MAG: hypothetical protein ACM3O9_08990 [Methylocystaceae bacterium]
MGMRPIDVQISIPRTAEVGRIAQGDQQQNQMRQQEVASQSQVHTDNYENKVRNSEHADAKKIKDEKDREKKKQQDKKRAQQSVDEENESSTIVTSPQARGKLDILA